MRDILIEILPYLGILLGLWLIFIGMPRFIWLVLKENVDAWKKKREPSYWDQIKDRDYGPPFIQETYEGFLHRYEKSHGEGRDRFFAAKTSGADSAQLEAIDRERLQQDMLFDAEYRRRLPFTPLSRCPYCGITIRKQIDPFDTGGDWWHVGLTAPDDCEHSFVVQGALHLMGQEKPFTYPQTAPAQGAYPGPEVPFIIPRLMKFESMKLVISSLPIADGRHTAYILAYFADPRPAWIEGTQGWCCKSFASRGPKESGWAIRNEAYDYELAPYIDAGQVLWVKPGDETLNLVSGKTADCPYYDLPGKRERQLFTRGEVVYVGNPTGEPPFFNPFEPIVIERKPDE